MRYQHRAGMGSRHDRGQLPSWFWMLALAAAMTATLAPACGARGGGLFGPAAGFGGTGGEGATGGSGGSGGELPPAKADKLDLLLVIDNSGSMADKQELLSLAVPNLLDSLLNPVCLDANGMPIAQPTSPDEPCPAGSERQFPPLTDIHFGVITTSLGGHGADICTGVNDPSENDDGRLMTRGPGGIVTTYDGKGFLAWDPQGNLDPAGQASAGTMETNLKALVLGAGQRGCGFEATLESWYRFLIDPDPYLSIEIQENSAVLIGTDNVLLQQRKDFLRPDSLLVLLMVTDENDCSIRDGGQFYFAAQIFQPGSTTQYHLPKPRAICATDPNSPCCKSCGQAPGDGCDTSEDDCSGALDPIDDHINLRCWDQKRRFGIDFLSPIDRYIDGLNASQIADRNGNVMANPLFDGPRDPRLVIAGAMLGVPWQDISRQDVSGNPDLAAGFDVDGRPLGGFQSAAELSANGTWGLILGDPAGYHSAGTWPGDPLMKESVSARSGVHPITGEAVAPPSAGTYANSINGHEFSIPNRDDLQYSCIFDLISPRNCGNPNEYACECDLTSVDNPLCQDENGDYGEIQFRAKAYPPIRELQLLEAAGDQAVLTSVCPAQLFAPAEGDFGYGPTIRSLVEAMAPILQP